MKIETNIPTPPPSLSAVLRALKPKESMVLANSPETVRTIVSRLHAEFGDRQYQTAMEPKGIRVWRLK